MVLPGRTEDKPQSHARRKEGAHILSSLTCEHFKASDACLAVLLPGRVQPELVSVIPRKGQWDLDLLTDFLRHQRVTFPRNMIMAPLSRRARSWAALGLRRSGEFERHSQRALLKTARVISESIDVIDWHRIVEVRSRIDRKIMEQLRPQDLFYQILHGLRPSLHYTHLRPPQAGFRGLRECGTSSWNLVQR
jgi:hypothetical protein